jgi:hypothetical protein
MLRVLSYDVGAQRADPDALARTVRESKPDVVCLQRVPHRLRWRSKCAALARVSGLVVVSGGRFAGANLIMSTLSVDVEAVDDVPIAAVAQLRFRGTEFTVAAAGSGRAAELESLLGARGDAQLVVVEGARITGRVAQVVQTAQLPVVHGHRPVLAEIELREPALER